MDSDDIIKINKELNQLRSRVGINDQNMPNGNGMIGRVESLESSMKDINSTLQAISRKLDEAITPLWLKQKVIALASVATAITVVIVFYERYIKGGI